MRKRWQVLSGISSFGVMSFMAALALGRGFDTWFWLGLGGFGAACGVSLWAAIVDYQRKWPAAIALATFAPFAERLIGGVKLTGTLFSFEVIVCSISTVVAAVAIMIMKVPPRDEIAPARVV